MSSPSRIAFTVRTNPGVHQPHWKACASLKARSTGSDPSRPSTVVTSCPAAGDLPRLTHELIEREGAEVHGLGETALPPVPAAIGNALASLGVHVTELPITAERVVEALDSTSHDRAGAMAS